MPATTTKILQLLGDFVPQIPYWGYAPGHRWKTLFFFALVSLPPSQNSFCNLWNHIV